jgi:hypothetical protein
MKRNKEINPKFVPYISKTKSNTKSNTQPAEIKKTGEWPKPLSGV